MATTKPPKTPPDTTSTTPVAAAAGSPQGVPFPAVAEAAAGPVTVVDGAPAEATTPATTAAPAQAKVAVLTPYEWASRKQVDRALVEGAAVLAGWPAGNLREGTILVDEAGFDAALADFTGMEIG